VQDPPNKPLADPDYTKARAAARQFEQRPAHLKAFHRRRYENGLAIPAGDEAALSAAEEKRARKAAKMRAIAQAGGIGVIAAPEVLL
jgi:hypothetical protein